MINFISSIPKPGAKYRGVSARARSIRPSRNPEVKDRGVSADGRTSGLAQVVWRSGNQAQPGITFRTLPRPGHQTEIQNPLKNIPDNLHDPVGSIRKKRLQNASFLIPPRH